MELTADDIFTYLRSIASNWKILAICGLGTIYLLVRKMALKMCPSQARLDGKTALVTGANTGIGKETARGLAQRGARVILACRDSTKAEAAAADIRKTTGNNDVVVRIVDLASLLSVRKLAKTIIETEPSLHILINNAAVFCPKMKSQDGYELQFAVNHLSHFLLTNLLLDKLKQSAPSRVVSVSSMAYPEAKMNFEDLNLEKSYSRMKAYGQSKLANILFTRELHKRIKGSGVTAYVLHPGVVRTEIARHTLWMKIVVLLMWPFRAYCNSVRGAQTSIHCAVCKGLEVHSGKYFRDCELYELEAVGKDDIAAEKLWNISAKMIDM